MKIITLETANPGLRWMRQYYQNNPELNAKKASLSLRNSFKLLKQEPFIGRKFDHFENIFEFNISATRFSILYTVKPNHIMIIDVRDQRGLRSHRALKQYIKIYKDKYQI